MRAEQFIAWLSSDNVTVVIKNERDQVVYEKRLANDLCLIETVVLVLSLVEDLR
jgi:hypothetical protein